MKIKSRMRCKMNVTKDSRVELLELISEFFRISLGVLEVVLVLAHLVLAGLELFILHIDLLLQVGDLLIVGFLEVLGGLNSLFLLLEVKLALVRKDHKILLDLENLFGLLNFLCKKSAVSRE